MSLQMLLRIVLWAIGFYGIGRYLFDTNSVYCLIAGALFGLLYELYSLTITLIAVIMRASDFFSKGLGIKGDIDENE